MVVLGDSHRLPFKYSQIWHAFKMKILFTIWKDHNVILFSHNFLDIHVAMYSKARVYNNVMMQIQVQTDKATLEVSHLQELLTHWGNAPVRFL